MRPLNDDQMHPLLREAMAVPPKPTPGFGTRVMKAYQTQSVRSSIWSRMDFGTVRIPIPACAVAAIALILLGVMFGRGLGAPPGPRNGLATSPASPGRPVLNLYG